MDRADPDGGRGSGAVWQAVFGLVFLGALVALAGPARVAGSLLAADPGWALAAAAVVPALAAADALRQALAFARHGLRFRVHLSVAFAGQLAAQLGFGFLGTDAYKFAVLRRRGIAGTELAAVLTATRLSALAALAGGTFAGGLLWLAGDQDGAARQAVAASVLASALTLAAGAASVWGLRRFPRLRRLAPLRAREALRHARMAEPALVRWLLAFGIVLTLLRGLFLWFAVFACAGTLPYLEVFLAAALATLAATVPVAAAGTVLRDGTLAGMLSVFGMPLETAVSVAVLSRVLTLAAAACGAAAAALPLLGAARAAAGADRPG